MPNQTSIKRSLRSLLLHSLQLVFVRFVQAPLYVQTLCTYTRLNNFLYHVNCYGPSSVAVG